jgi:hypothetical protein
MEVDTIVMPVYRGIFKSGDEVIAYYDNKKEFLEAMKRDWDELPKKVITLRTQSVGFSGRYRMRRIVL